jgi:hypothetical protein
MSLQHRVLGRVDVAEFMAIAKAVNADAIELFRQAMR